MQGELAEATTSNCIKKMLKHVLEHNDPTFASTQKVVDRLLASK